MGKAELSGTVQQISQRPTLRTQMTANDVQPSGVFAFFIREMLHHSYPALDQLTVGGGVDLTAQVYGTFDQLSAEGHLQVRSGNLGITSNAMARRSDKSRAAFPCPVARGRWRTER